MAVVRPSPPTVAILQTPTAGVAPAPEPHFGYNIAKRATDIVGAATLIVLTLPLFVLVAMLVVITSGSPIFFVQRRLALLGVEFGCCKFRTMVRDAEGKRDEVLHLNVTDGPTLKLEDDPRVTKLGKFLRRTSLDELPQLWNVLIGDMSLVGPRPLPVIENRYKGEQSRRLSVKPGITCIWQVSGRSRVTFGEWMDMDLSYVENRTLLMDLWLMVKTVPAVLRARGAM
jgi:lipopolysaccharide/colanic/teichoic acid biosynthesis glycosyltransferase